MRMVTSQTGKKPEMFNAFFVSVFNTDDGPRGYPWSSELEDHDCDNDELPVVPEIVGSAAPAEFSLNLWGLMEFIKEFSKSLLMSLQSLS